MPLSVSGLWFSYIKKAPDGEPNDGVFNVKNLGSSGAGPFDGVHLRSTSEKPIKGDYIEATPGKPDRITFTETDPDDQNCTFTYDGKITAAGKNLTAEGKRHRDCEPPPNPESVELADDDWVGTHTT
jgi:hypothetical protein